MDTHQPVHGHDVRYAVNNPIKRIGISTSTDNQTVAYAGTNLFDAKQSIEGAFSLSVDDGYTFNDISLVHTNLLNILDQAIAPDGGDRYVISNATPLCPPWQIIIPPFSTGTELLGKNLNSYRQ